MEPNLQANSAQKAKTKRTYAVMIMLMTVLCIAGFLRLWDLKTLPPGLYPDEAMNGNNALEAVETGKYKVFYPENNGREGLFINIQAFFLKLFMGQNGSPEPWMLRFPSALFGILTVLGIYFLTKELFNKAPSAKRQISNNDQNSNNQNTKLFGIKIALLATFFLAVSFWHINFSRIGFRAIMAPMFLVWSVFLLIFSFRKYGDLQIFKIKNPKHEAPASPAKRGERNSEQTQNSNYPNSKRFLISNFKNWNLFRISDFGFRISIPAILAGMVYGLGMHSYIAYRATPLLIVFILWLLTFKYGWRVVLKIGALFVVGAIITSLPLIIYFAENPQDFFGRTTQVSIFAGDSAFADLGTNIAKTIGMFFVYGDENWRHNISGAPELFWPVAVFFAIGIAVGIKEIFVKNPKHKTQNSKQYQNSNLFRISPARRSLGTGGDFGFRILLMWLIVAALPVIISNEGIPHALRAILMIPPAYILAAFGGVWIYEQFLKPRIHQKLLVTGYLLLITILVLNAYHAYFITWGKNPEVAGAFSKNYVEIGKELNALPTELPKYVIVEAGGVNVRGLPMSTQTTMFITNTFAPKKQKEKNIFYVLPNEKEKIPAGAYVLEIK